MSKELPHKIRKLDIVDEYSGLRLVKTGKHNYAWINEIDMMVMDLLVCDVGGTSSAVLDVEDVTNQRYGSRIGYNFKFVVMELDWDNPDTSIAQVARKAVDVWVEIQKGEKQ